MSLFLPTCMMPHISDISTELLETMDVSVVVLDVDNTLTTHNNPIPDDRALKWLAEMKEQGYHLVILSNNKGERVRLFAELLELDYTANAMKPLKKGFRETAARLGITPLDMVVVGDQIFTDILGGNLFGCKSILVEPMELEKSWGFRLKRKLEKGFIRKIRRLQKERGNT